MTRDDWEKVKQIFGDALERPPDERESFVRDAAKGDPELRAKVLVLLAENDRESGLLSRPALADARMPAVDDKPQFAPASILARRFRVIRFIARGGMGEVYEAEDLELGERVALKAIRRRVADGESLRTMFKREIQLARRVTHPNVCRIFDMAQHEDAGSGGPAILLSMELIEGQTLAEYLRRTGPMAYRDALPIIDDIAAGLQAVHDAGVIHGDLKPGNVMLVPRPGEAKVRAVVMDFGMALPGMPGAAAGEHEAGQESAGGSPTVSSQREWLLRGGTPEYFAPELTQGNPATTATDVYAFALVIADMLGMPRPVRLKPESQRMPYRWAQVLRRSLEADPSRRYGRPSEMASALRRPDPRLIGAAAAMLVLLLAAVAAIVFRAGSERPRGPGTQMVLNQQDEESWAPSPDGRYLAVSMYSHDADLVLRDIESGKISTVAPHAGRCWAVFSPDGRHIAFVRSLSRTDQELNIVAVDGKGERTVFHVPETSPQPLDWSPDGKEILARLVNGQSTRIAAISVADGSIHAVPVPEQGLQGHALFAEDANSILVTYRLPGGRTEIHRVTRGGGESVVITSPRSNLPVAWSPDRRRLIFLSDRKGGRGIWAVTVSSSGYGEPTELASNVGDWIPLGIDRSGTLFYQIEADSVDVYTAVLDLGAARTVSPPRPVMESLPGTTSWPNWNEDGIRLVFVSRPAAPQPPTLIVYDPANGSKRELAVELERADRPQWTSHGGTIMILGRPADGPQGQYRINPSTGNARLFMSDKDLESAYEGAWSNDGSIHFNRFSDWRRGIFRMDAATRERLVLFRPPAGVDLGTENLTLSPDGQTLAFHARNDSARSADLVLIPARGGQAQSLLTVHQPEMFRQGAFTWTPDGKSLLIARSTSGASELWQVPVDGSTPRRIDFPYKMLINSLRLNPDGKTIAFTKVDYRNEIWMRHNFL